MYVISNDKPANHATVHQDLAMNIYQRLVATLPHKRGETVAESIENLKQMAHASILASEIFVDTYNERAKNLADLADLGQEGGSYGR